MEIDEKFIRKLNRQLRSIRIMLGFFTLVTLAVLGIWVYMAYKFVTFTQNVNDKITTIQNTTTQKLDIKSQLCDEATSSLARQLCNE
jgi:cell division protein FtsL